MPPRQLWIFKFGCWATLGTAVLHLAGHLWSLPVPADAGQVTAGYHLALPGDSERSLVDLLDGFRLLFALLLAAMGSTGLIVQRRAGADLELMLAVARAMAVTCSGDAGASRWRSSFCVPTMLVALMTVSFAVGERAEVARPGRVPRVVSVPR